MFKVKNYNVSLEHEIAYISDKISEDIVALNVRKTEYSLLASPYSIAKLSEIYLDGGMKRDYLNNRSYRRLDNVASVMNPYGKAVAQLGSDNGS